MDNTQIPDDDGVSRLPSMATVNSMPVERHPPTALALPTSVRPQPDDDDDDGGLDLRELWHIVTKRKWTVITFTLILFVSVMTVSFLMTPIYCASLTLQIERQEAKVVDYQSVTPNEMSTDSREFYQTQYELLKSRTLAQQVIDRLNLVDNPIFNVNQETQSGAFAVWVRGLFAGHDAAAGLEEGTPQDPVKRLVTRFLDNLTIQPITNSRLVRIDYESPDPELATRIVNAISTSFIDLNLRRRMEAASYATNFLQERLQQTKTKLEDSEKALVAFSRASQIVRGNAAEQLDVDSQALQAITTALAKAQDERIGAEALYKQTLTSDGEGLPMVLDSKVIQELKQVQAKLEAEYQENLKIFKPGYSQMQQLRGQIDGIQSKIDQEVGHIRSAIQTSYQTALKRETALKAKLDETKQLVLGIQDRSIQYNILKREVDTNRQLYDGLLQRYKEVGIAGGVGINNVSVVDPAERPSDPAKPNKLKNALIALVLGLIGGIGLAFLFEHLDDTVKDGESLEQLTGLSVLGVVPLIIRKDKAEADELILSELAETRSGFAEAYRSLRTALQFSTAAGMPKILMVSSSSMGEGKSTTALALAVNLGLAGSKVLLIDCDLRKASLHRKLGIDNSRGLTNYLASDMELLDITHKSHHPGLFVIPSGPLPPNPAELLGGDRMRDLLELARSRFHCVIIDAPPVLGLADAPILGSLADGVAIVVEAGKTRKSHLFGALKRLAATRSPLVGAVLTKFDARTGSYGSYGHYYYYNNYYQYGDRPSGAMVTTPRTTVAKS